MRRRQNAKLFFGAGIFTALTLLLMYLLLSNTSPSNGTEAVVEVVLIPKVIDVDNDFWEAMTAGAKLAAHEKGINLTILGTPYETDIDGQNNIIEQAIAMHPNAIVLAPSGFDKTVPYARKVQEAGIKLILIDSKISDRIGVSLVATDNVEGGRKMGEFMKDKLDENSKIGIVGHVKGASTATEREQGIRQGLGEHQDKIAEVVFCDSNYSKAFQVTSEMLERNPDMNVIFGMNEYSAVGAARAVKALGLQDQITMVGFDSSLEEVQMLEAGIFDAIVVQKPMNMGYLGVSLAYQEALSTETPSEIDSGSVLITRDTIYTDENQKLLFPFRESE